MKILTTIILSSFTMCLTAQNKIIGTYKDNFGNRIQLNADNTFKYTWNFDLSASWTKGIWIQKNDTIFFQMVPTYDTLSYVNNNNLKVDTLILSDDELSQRITPIESAGILLSSGGQNRKPHPDKLLVKSGRLYKIQNGKVILKKPKGFWTNEKWNPWYFKIDE